MDAVCRLFYQPCAEHPTSVNVVVVVLVVAAVVVVVIIVVFVLVEVVVAYDRVGQKNRTCLSVDNSAVVTHRKACDMSKFLECCRQKGPNLHSKLFKYSLPNLHKFLLGILLKLGICLHSYVPEFIEVKTHCQNGQI